MKKYTVTWGEDSFVVEADSETDAWAKFVDGNELARRHPKSRERTIEEVEEVAEAEVPVATGVSPLADQNADEAIDSIGRMRSVERLQEVVDFDTRTTVVFAARKRLSEL